MRRAWLLCCWLAWCAPAAAEPALAFRIDEGQNLNSFLQQGPVAAHLLLRNGTQPRLLVAFPAGNSGVGLWFQSTATPVTWTLASPPRAIGDRDGKGRPMHGIEFDVTVSVPALQVRGAVLSSIRVLRDYELAGKAPGEVLVEPVARGDSIRWLRDRLDGAAGYELDIQSTSARVTSRGFESDAEPLRLRVRALTGETPLTPLPGLLSPEAGDDVRARNALGFLSYHEKFLAGSWRFDTYFGRDTLISALLLAPVLEPPALESAISSVLDRLAPNGEVAHEEDIGEFAVLRNAREGRGRVATPLYDYGMVDDDFLLAPLAARWLIDDARSRGRARAFLAGRSASGETRGRLLVRNLVWLVQRSAAFADHPRFTNLIAIKPGRMTGNWRDSDQGLGRGRYAFDVNAALVPAALEAAAALHDSGLLAPDAEERRTLSRARAQAKVWAERAPSLFTLEIPTRRAEADVVSYARELGVAPRGIPSVPGEPAVRFHALSLDVRGRPVPILHSDEGFRLLLMNPPADELTRTVDALLRPFPAGLMTDAGLLVANPVHAPRELRREFSARAYHGTVVWSWQQALLVAGIDRQLQRTDLPAASRTQLQQARAALWRVIEGNRGLRTSELWSWTWSDGRFRAEAFGRPGADADESNAAQLWSTVFLGLAPLASPAD